MKPGPPGPPSVFVFVFPRPPATSEGPGLPLTERSKTLGLADLSAAVAVLDGRSLRRHLARQLRWWSSRSIRPGGELWRRPVRPGRGAPARYIGCGGLWPALAAPVARIVLVCRLKLAPTARAAWLAPRGPRALLEWTDPLVDERSTQNANKPAMSENAFFCCS